VVELTAGDPPGEATHWTAAVMAKATGITFQVCEVFLYSIGPCHCFPGSAR
jgi:hypothetical protein